MPRCLAPIPTSPHRALPARHQALHLAVLMLCGGAALPALSAETPPAPEQAASAPATTSVATGQPLEQIVITGNRRPATPAVSRTTLSGEELRRVPGTGGDPVKALQSLPGVATTTDASSEPAIRGSRPSDNAYYVDELPVGYLFHLGGLVSTLHPDLVNKFELYSAAFGPEYDNVLGGVLDVTLRAPRTDRLGGKLDVSLLGASGLIEGPVGENQSFYFAARRSYFDLLLKKDLTDDDTGVILTVPHYYDYQGKYLWQLNDDHRLTLHATGAADKLKFNIPPGSLYATQDPLLAGSSQFDLGYGSQALVWNGRFDADTSHRLALGHTLTRQTSSVGTAADVHVAVRNLYLREELRLRPHPDHDVALGATLNRVRVGLDLDASNPRCTEFDPNCDYTNAPRLQLADTLRAQVNDFHAKDRWKLDPAWTLTTGLHHSRDSYLQRNHTEPRLALEWKWSDATLLSAGWGRHHQMPEGIQILRDFGNPLLWHVRATHSVLGLTQKFDGGWSARTELYHKQFSDFVVADPVLNYANGASGQARGIELLLKKDAAGTPFSGWLSLSWSKAERHNDRTGENFPFEFDQPLIATLVANWHQSDEWQFGAKWSWHSGSPVTPIVGTGTYPDGRIRPLYGEINSERLPGYHRLDLRADRIFSPNFKGYAELINAYNRKNVSGYNYSADYSSRKPVTQLPLLVSFGIEMGF